MSRPTLIPFHSLLAFSFFALPVAASDARLSESYGKLPLQFEANCGQVSKEVQFLSHGASYGLYLTPNEAVLVLTKPDAKAHGKSVALRMSLVGGARKAVVSGLDEQPGKANYYIGSDPSKWRTNVPTYAKVRYREVYPGIDLVYYGNQRQLEYDFVVAPGADPNKIVLGFKGAEKLAIDAQGDLVLQTRGGKIRQHKPVVYQDIDGARHEIAGSYVRKGANRIAFKIAAYDPTRPLVIDPVVLSYSTYLGGTSVDAGKAIAVDAAGNAYVTGYTISSDFPTTPGAVRTTQTFPEKVFVTKLNPSGTAFVYSAIVGGESTERATGIAVDGDGNAYVTGYTSSANFPTTPGALQTVRGTSPSPFGTPPQDAFVTKLSTDGSRLVYSTFLGGSGSDGASRITVDASGNAYVVGGTTSADFPVTAGAYQTSCAPVDSCADAFVARLNPDASGLVYSTFLGGGQSESASGIAVDRAGNAYVAGSTNSLDFPTTPGAFQPAYAGGLWDAFVTKLDPTGTALVYSTYLGAGDFDQAFAIAVDPGGNAYVTGRTGSTDFPTVSAFQAAFDKQRQFMMTIFVTKLDLTGSTLVYSTFLGGTAGDEPGAIALDAAGSAYLTGVTNSTDFPITPGAFQPAHAQGNSQDAFVTQLAPSGSSLVYSTYLGGTDFEYGYGIAVDAAGSAYVTGETGVGGFPTTPDSPKPAFTGNFQDGFVAKFADAAPPPPAPTGTGTTRSEESAATQIGFWTSYGAETGTFSDGSIAASNVVASTAMFSFTGTAVSWIGVKCNVCGVAAVSIDGGVPTMVNTAGPGAPGALSSEPVFSASGLAARSHMITIAVTGTSNSGGSYVALDAFDVTTGSAAPPLLPPVVLPPPPVTLPPLPPILGL